MCFFELFIVFIWFVGCLVGRKEGRKELKRGRNVGGEEGRGRGVRKGGEGRRKEEMMAGRDLDSE